jgi:hypothetical protein
MVFENRMLRRIFGPKKDEVTGGWIGLHNDEFHNLNYFPSTTRMKKAKGDKMGGACGTNGENRNSYMF